MLLKSYRKEIFRPECNPSFQSLHCFAHLDQDVSESLPYLNANLGGFDYFEDPPSLTLRVHGRLITVHSRKIAINALKDTAEADKILEWLKKEINEAWADRNDIEPKYTGMPKPQVMEILKRLPKTNCGECGEPTCTTFAVSVAEGGRSPNECPPLEDGSRAKIDDYLEGFQVARDEWW
ncbi:(Fe-S)-binding protein [Thermodesulfobacteriota bacterium]